MQSIMIKLVALSLVASLGGPVTAQDRAVPYWATIRAEELNMRVGPSADFPVAWVYRRPGLPVKVLRLQEGWRLIEDPAGTQGWVVARLLDPARGAMVIGDTLAPMRADPSPESELRWRLEPGVVGALGDCEKDWCRLTIGEYRGWVEAERLWGDEKP